MYVMGGDGICMHVHIQTVNVVFCRLSRTIYMPHLHVHVLLDFPVSKDMALHRRKLGFYQIQCSSLVPSAKL